MRIRLNGKNQYVPQERLRQANLQTALDIFRNPELYELGRELVARPPRWRGGAPRVYPDWLILGFNALASQFGGARGAASELAVKLSRDMTLYSVILDVVRDIAPTEVSHHVPKDPPTREWFSRKKALITQERHDALRVDFTRSAVELARYAGLLDPSGPGSPTHPTKSRLIEMDGKVFTPITSAHSTKTRTARFLDALTGEVVEEEVPVRCEPDAHEYETGDDPRVTGVKTWHCEVRSDDPHERVILAVDHVPGNKGEANSENHVAIANMLQLAPLVPGALGCITDGVLRGEDINTLKRATGWIVISPVPAEHVDAKTGERTERQVQIEELTFPYPDKDDAAVQIWAVRGQLHYKDWDEEGTAFLQPLRHEEVVIRGRPGAFRHYVKVSVPDPRGGRPRIALIRSYTNDDDRKRGLNRAEWVRDIPPLDPRYEALFGRREDAENLNNIFETALPYRRARSYTAENIVFDVLAHAFAINSVTRARASRRKAKGQAA